MSIARLTIFLLLWSSLWPSLCLAEQLLVLNKGDASLSFIDPQSGQTAATIPTGTGPHEIEVSSDGKLAVVSNYGTDSPGNTLSVIDVATRRELRRIDLGELRRPHGLTFLKGRLYFTAEGSRRIGRLNAAATGVDWSFDTRQEVTHMVLGSRDGTRLFATNMDSNSVSVLTRSSGADEWTQTLIAVGTGPEGLDQSPDGRELWTAHSRDGAVSVIDISGNRVTAKIDAQTRRSNRLKFTPDGKRVLISDYTAGELVVLDPSTRSVVKRLPIGKSPAGILIQPDGRLAYVALTAAKHVAVVDLQTLAVVRQFATGTGPDGMAWVH